MKTSFRNQFCSIVAGCALMMSTLTPQFAAAQTQTKHHKLKTAAAAVGAYEVAKHTGKKRLAHGRHRNVFQKHPVATGIAAGAAAHHAMKHKKHKPQP